MSGGWRRKEEEGEEEGVSHIPGLMHEAIDSASLPEHCPHFKESMEGGWREAGGEEENRSVCLKKGGVGGPLSGGEQSC